ncbi:MAG: hypothetical protein KGO53_06510 [Alphaproteobacteria bacterium]|nr:hypothetical protein [Alphaproteobacteria bacterium]
MMRKTLLACAFAAVLPFHGAMAGDAKLSASQLRGLAPGAYEVAVMDVVSLNVRLFANGKIVGDTGGQHDTGHWHVAGDRLCISWSKWLGGQMRCSSLSDQNGALIGNGLTIKRI